MKSLTSPRTALTAGRSVAVFAADADAWATVAGTEAVAAAGAPRRMISATTPIVETAARRPRMPRGTLIGTPFSRAVVSFRLYSLDGVAGTAGTAGTANPGAAKFPVIGPLEVRLTKQ
ncbi:hypothetical protein GCM10009563_03700 [Subtercola frigoramans]